jgi:hypothetical protein
MNRPTAILFDFGGKNATRGGEDLATLAQKTTKCKETYPKCRIGNSPQSCHDQKNCPWA